MSNLDISFLHTSVRAPRGFAEAEVRIGSHRETVFSDQSIWAKQDYVDHWKATSAKVLEGASPIIFCSSLGKDGADLWIGQRSNDELRIFNINTAYSNLVIDDKLLIACSSCDDLLKSPSEEWSSWVVPVK